MTNRSADLANIATWLASVQALHDFGRAAFLSLVPLFFMRAPAAVWVGAILELITEYQRRAA